MMGPKFWHWEPFPLEVGLLGSFVPGPAGVNVECLRRWSPVRLENKDVGPFVAPGVLAALGAAS